MELQAGLWIAQGQAINVLLNIKGKSPLLEIVGAIDLNYFERTGKAKSLSKDSDEIADILDYPENYRFSVPAITDAIYNKDGLGSKRFEKSTRELTPEEASKATEQFRSLILIHGFDRAKIKLRTYLRNEFKLTMRQAVDASNQLEVDFKQR